MAEPPKGSAAKEAGYIDFDDFMDKPLDGFPPRTVWELNGEPMDMSKLGDDETPDKHR